MFIPDPGSDFFPSRIPDPNCLHPGSRILTVSIADPGSSSKNLSILTPKKAKKWFLSSKKWFLSSKKYDPGCSSRIRMLTFSHPGSRIQGSKKHPIPDPDPQHCPTHTFLALRCGQKRKIWKGHDARQVGRGVVLPNSS